MRIRVPLLRALALPVLLGTLFLIACQLGGEDKVEATLSFNQIFDSLSQYDKVLITLKDKDGNTIDVLFGDKVRVPADVEKLSAPHWDGGKITVSIIGYKGGVVVYRSEADFDGANNKKDSVYIFVAPEIGLSFPQSSIPMLEGDSINLPSITITPRNLKKKDLNWVSSAPDVVRIGSTGFKAFKPGNARITVSLVSDSTKTLTIDVTVVDPAKIPESLTLSSDTLKVTAGGAPGRLDLQFVPSTAARDVVWSTLDTTIATVSANGIVKGKMAGATRLIVVSSLKSAVSDTAEVVVILPKPPEKVVFAKDETEIFIGGASEVLSISILPPEASQEVDFTVSAPLLINLQNGRINGLGQGEGAVIATSKENPLLADTLKVKVSVKQQVSSVSLSKHALTVFTGGDEPSLTAAIEPSTTNQKVQWHADQPGIAKVSDAGKVTGLSQGHTRIHAISLADSTKQDSADVTVRTDAPEVNIGRPDTTVSVGAMVKFLPVVPVQAFGEVVAFRWDVDGIPGWDDSSKAVQEVSVTFAQEKNYTLRFYVRDTEGNETIAIKKVSAIIGPVVTIVTPVTGAYVNTAALKIEWKIDNVVQTTGTDTVLKDGANTITRSAKNAAGQVFSHTVTVYLDTVPPSKPSVKGPSVIVSGEPTWTWAPGGGGNGAYRIALDSQNFVGRPEIRDTLYTPQPGLADGVHTLYVQERDAAGNWSLPGKITTVVDRSGPSKPIVKVNVASPTNVKRPIWTWVSGGGAGSGIFQFKFDNANFSTGASIPAADIQFIPSQNLEGLHILYVRERDSLGNWSEIGNGTVTIDTTAPGAPKILATSPTGAAPKWTWSSGGGGSGAYRFKVGGDPATSPETQVLEYVLTGAVSKTTYILYVQERDSVGNWSSVANASVLYDLTKPSVTFTAPQISGTYMTKLATVDLAGIATSPQGAGSIKSISYTVDGVAGVLSTNMAGDGSWNIKALPLTNNKTIAVKIIATDVANNIGEATLNILWDNTAPAAPTFTAQPASPLNKADSRTSLTWTWNQPVGADSFVVKLNGAEVARQVGNTFSVNSLTDGMYTLEVAEKDLTGNISAFTSANGVLVDRLVPDAPVVSVSSTPTRNSKPTWSWGSGGTGQFEYRIANGSDPTGTGIAIVGTSYTPANPLADGTWYLQSRGKDLAGNWSSWSASGVVMIKGSAPAAPSVVRNGSPTNAPKWTWSSGGGGSGTFRYRWNGNTAYLGEGASTEYAPNLADGNYNLCVSERDAVGYGVEACASLAVDKTAPVIKNLFPADGFITNKSSVSITFEKDGISASFTCDLTDGASKLCSQTVSDAAGNSITVSRTIWYRSNVVFVKAGGTGDGSSWERPAMLDSVLVLGRNLNKEVWLAAGDYSNESIAYLYAGSGMKIFGGFSATGYPNSISQRNSLSGSSTVTKRIGIQDMSGPAQDVLIDGISFTRFGHIAMYDNSLRITVRNCFFVDLIRQIPSAVEVRGTDIRLENLLMKNNLDIDYAAISVYYGSGNVEIVGGDFRNNRAGVGGGAVLIYNGNVTIKNNAVFMGNSVVGASNQITVTGGHLDISGCQIQDGVNGITVSDPSMLTYGNNQTLNL